MMFLLYLSFIIAAARAVPSASVTTPPRVAERNDAQTSAVNEFSVLWSDALSIFGHLFPSATSVVAATTTTSATSAWSSSADHGMTRNTDAVPTTSYMTAASEKNPVSHATSLSLTTTSTLPSSTSSTFATSTRRSTLPPSTTSQSTTPLSSATAAAASQTTSRTAMSATSSSNDPNQATIIVLAILCTIFGLIALGCLLWYLYQAYRRRQAPGSEYESDSEAGDYTAGLNEPQMAEDQQHRYDDRAIPPLPLDAHRFSKYEISDVSPSSDPGNPFRTPAPSISPMQRSDPVLATTAAAASLHRHENTPRWSTGPMNGPWAPPSPNRPKSVNLPGCYPDAHRTRSFDLGYGGEGSIQKSFLQNRRSAPRLNTGGPSNSLVGPASPLSAEPWSAGSANSMNPGLTRTPGYQNNLYHIDETRGH